MTEREITSLAEFEALIERPENRDKRFELIDGEIVELSPSKDAQTILGARMVYFISAHVIPNDLGYVIGADGGFKLSKKDFFAPDAAFIEKSRYPAVRHAYFNIAPDLAVEVISPGNKKKDVDDKVKTYLRLGTKLVWLVYPISQTIVVHQPGKAAETLTMNDTLDGGSVLPGFTLAVSEIFKGL